MAPEIKWTGVFWCFKILHVVLFLYQPCHDSCNAKIKVSIVFKLNFHFKGPPFRAKSRFTHFHNFIRQRKVVPHHAPYWKSGYLCLIPASTTRFASDVQYRMATNLIGLYQEINFHEHLFPQPRVKNTIFLHTFWRPFLDCMAQLFSRPQYVWFLAYL